MGDLLTLLVSWVTQAIHWHMQHTHLNVHCALIQLTVAVPPMLVYLRLELDQNRIREGQGMSPLTAPAIAQVPEAGYRE